MVWSSLNEVYNSTVSTVKLSEGPQKNILYSTLFTHFYFSLLVLIWLVTIVITVHWVSQSLGQRLVARGSVLAYLWGTGMEEAPFSGKMMTRVHVLGSSCTHCNLDFLGWCWHLLAHSTRLLQLGIRVISQMCWVCLLADVELKFSFLQPSLWNEIISGPITYNGFTWYWWTPRFKRQMCLKQMSFCPVPLFQLFQCFH